MPNPKKHCDKEQEWRLLYEQGLSVHKIGARYGIGGQSVHNTLKRTGVVFRTLEQSIRKNAIRVDAFKTPLSAEASYWLGLLYADGSMVMARKTGFYVVSLVAHGDDEESITGFLSFLGLNGPVIRRPDKNAVSTAITSKTVAADLLSLGVIPAKTHKLKWPCEIKGDLVPHFVRGFFDGDGSVGFRLRKRYVTPQGTLSFCGSTPFLHEMASQIETASGFPPSALYCAKERPQTGQLRYEGRLRLIGLYQWLYGDGGPCLSRKKMILERGLFPEKSAAGYAGCAYEVRLAASQD